jgi:UDP-N-acetylmuramoyl-L-alanyl-D-glutamate--2,6-diaminopimelate ligase
MKLIDMVWELSYTLKQGTLEKEITQLVYDSRKVVPGCLFVCVSGTVSDGHKYIPDALAKGATALVVEKEVENIPEDVTVLLVPGARFALGNLAAAWFGHPARKLKTIGITGTKGKTTTTYMMREILEHAGHKTGLIGTIEAIIGEEHIPAANTTPESYVVQQYFRRMVDAGCECVVMEVSSQALKMDRVTGFLFDYGIFTNLAEDHISPLEHADMEEYAACKALLFRRCKVGIVNADDPSVDQILAGHTCQLKTFGHSKGADFYATDVTPVHRPGYLGVQYQLCGEETATVDVDIPGDFTVYNSLAAIALCRQMNVPMEDILAALQTIQVKGRLEVIHVPGGYTLMIDYAHNAVSLESLLLNLKRYARGRIICLFGCGGNRAKSRRYEMGEVSSRLADLTVVTSDNPRDEEPMDIINDILEGVHKANGEYVTIAYRKEAIRYAMHVAKPNDFVILAGKGHEDYQEIHGVKHHMDERELVADILKEDGTQIEA